MQRDLLKWAIPASFSKRGRVRALQTLRNHSFGASNRFPSQTAVGAT